MILSDLQILKAIEEKDIVITPFDEKYLGPNSYDIHLSKNLAVYKLKHIDAKEHNELYHFEITETGFVLEPGTLYLGVTEEFTSTNNYVPCIEGRSSTGRLGISIHATAGIGDNGFSGYWTLEISCLQPVKVYPGMKIGQLLYYTTGECNNKYYKKDNNYYNQGNYPVESKMYKSWK